MDNYLQPFLETYLPGIRAGLTFDNNGFGQAIQVSIPQFPNLLKMPLPISSQNYQGLIHVINLALSLMFKIHIKLPGFFKGVLGKPKVTN